MKHIAQSNPNHVHVLLVGLVSVGLAASLVGCEKKTPASEQANTTNNEHSADDGHGHDTDTGHTDDHDKTGALLDEDTDANLPDEYTYTVRGEINQVPTAEEPLSGFRVHHEAIDSFVNRKGEMKGMNAMTMSFPLGEGVSLDGLTVGDKINMTFVVIREPWGFHVTEITKLADDTELVFGNADPSRVNNDDGE